MPGATPLAALIDTADSRGLHVELSVSEVLQGKQDREYRDLDRLLVRNPRSKAILATRDVRGGSEVQVQHAAQSILEYITT